jgi:hypothetical protein
VGTAYGRRKKGNGDRLAAPAERATFPVLATWDIRSWKTMDFSNGCPPEPVKRRISTIPCLLFVPSAIILITQ